MADLLSVLPAPESHYDPKWFRALTSAVARRRRIDLHYWAASRNEEAHRQFDLYDLYDLSLVDDGWCAIGHCHLRNETRMFAVQRVLSAN